MTAGFVTASATPCSAHPQPVSQESLTGGDVGGVLKQTNAEAARLAEKKALVAEYLRVRDGFADPADLAALESKFEDDAAPTTVKGNAKEAGPLAVLPPESPSYPASKTLPLTQYGQSKSYYCGPASAYMILKYSSAGSSNYDGASLSQSTLANSTYLQTEQRGATTWASGRFSVALNRWLFGSDSGYYLNETAPAAADFMSYVQYDIGSNGRPLAGDTVEFAGGLHYNGHPRTQTIGHWIVAYGYISSGVTTYWADPATTVWATVSPKFSYGTTSFANNFLQSNGVTW